jgi:hypothetical protein
MWTHLTPKSSNRKVGAIPVSTTESRSCPEECSLKHPLPGRKNGPCYGGFGPLGMHWKKVDNRERGSNFTPFCNRVRRFPAGQKWRHNQVGDLPQRKDGRLHRRQCLQLAAASAHTRGWTYTHYTPLNDHNARTIADMNKTGGLVVNLSADNMQDADKYYQLGIAPVVVVLPANAPVMGNKTPDGVPVVVCPAQTVDSMTCEQCMLCKHARRKSIVGFLAHGPGAKGLSDALN